MCLKEVGIDDKDLQIINHLYSCQTAKVRVEGDCSGHETANKGVR